MNKYKYVRINGVPELGSTVYVTVNGERFYQARYLGYGKYGGPNDINSYCIEVIQESKRHIDFFAYIYSQEENVQYCWSADGEDFSHCFFDTREEAVKDAEACEETSFYTAVAEPIDFPAEIDPDWVIERINDDAYSEYGEWAEDYLLGLDQNIVDDLGTRLNQALRSWIEEHNLQPTWFTVTDVEHHTGKLVE